MKERPILFSAPMVRAILDGRKTMTRRVVKPQPFETHPSGAEYQGLNGNGDHLFYPAGDLDDGTERAYEHDSGVRKCPYGQPGDRLWVRETWGVGTRPDPFDGWRDGVEYRADQAYLTDDIELLPLYPVTLPDDVELDSYKEGWHPSIFMPRWASRITLEITGVRVERLQEVSEDDAKAEGVEHISVGVMPRQAAWTCRQDFSRIWDRINGKKYPWDSNPWVWVIEFKRLANF